MAKDYDIARPDGLCSACGRQFQVAQEFMATIRQVEDGFARQDFCLDCWGDGRDEPAIIGVWRSRIPKAKEKKKLFVGDDVLMSFFRRLAETDEPARLTFRYVLTLILMRKKLLTYDGMATDEQGRDVWKVHVRGGDEAHEVVDPHMDEDQILRVSGDLGQIMEIDE